MDQIKVKEATKSPYYIRRVSESLNLSYFEPPCSDRQSGYWEPMLHPYTTPRRLHIFHYTIWKFHLHQCPL